MQITTVSIDIAKNVFHVIGCNASNKIMKKKAVKRKQLLSYLANIPSCTVVMEACATSNYWGREISALGHKVSLIPPQHVKAFLTGNKNDYNDAYAILIASQQAHIKPVAIKTVEQQDNQAVHNPTVADALLDRLLHNAHRLELTGESQRKKSLAEATEVS